MPDRSALLTAFATAKQDDLDRLVDSLRRSVRLALARRPSEQWSEALLKRVSSLLLAGYRDETERTSSENLRKARTRLLEAVEASLEQVSDDEDRSEQSERIAEMLAVAISNTLAVVVAQDEPESDDLVKTWASMLDDRVRDSHLNAHGQAVALSESFEVGGHKMFMPGDPSAPPSEVINCRCVVVIESRQAQPITAAAPEESVGAWSSNSYQNRPTGGQIMPEDVEIEGLDLDPDGAVPFYGVAAPEGTITADRRRFAEGSMRWRELPLPLLWQKVTEEGHDKSIIVGRIDTFERDGNLIWYSGEFLDTPEADEAINLIANRALRGISVDVYDAVMEEQDRETAQLADENTAPEDVIDTLTEGEIAGATLVAFPAFREAFIALGYREVAEDDLEEEEEVEALVAAISDKPWDGSAGRYTPEEWHRACLIHLHSGAPESKSQCKLPVKEPNGDLSRAGVHAAASRIGQVDAPAAQISKARSALRSFYKQLGEDFPESLTAALPPGLLKDGSPPQCGYCENRATGYVLHAEGMAYIPFCPEHAEKAKFEGECATPDGTRSPSNIDKIGEYSAQEFDSKEVEFAPGTQDGPGWLTHPVDTDRLRDYWTKGPGAAKIGWGAPGDFNRCRALLAPYVKPQHLAGYCANRHKDALGIWPGEHRSAEGAIIASSEPDEGIPYSDPWALTASAGTDLPPAEWFEDPHLTGPSPLVITEEGRIFGHLAEWGTCHIGFPGTCVTPPRSVTDYSYFRLGAVRTDKGDVPVGKITVGTGHAPLKANMAATLAHYDNTGTQGALVAAGEDEWGIWVAGCVAPGASRKQIDTMRAAVLSGDWRDVGGNLELVAALAVNVPGFPVRRIGLAASAGRQVSLVVAGVVENPDPQVPRSEIAAIVQEELDRRTSQEKARHALSTLASQRARREIEKIKGRH